MADSSRQHGPTDEDAIELIRQMVEIESFTGDERALAELIVSRMQDWGMDAYVDEAGNAVGIKLPSPSGRGVWGEGSSGSEKAPSPLTPLPEGEWKQEGAGTKDLVLLGHMDTVLGWIPVRLEDGVLSGRGSVDAKGPLAAFIVATARVTPPADCRLIVIGAVEEEGSSKGARHVRDQFRPEACIIGEPSNWDAVTLGYKGCMTVHYRREQPCGHSAGPVGGVAESAVAWWETVWGHAEKYNADRDRLFDQLLVSLRDIQTSSDGLADHVHAIVGVRLPGEFDVDDYVAKLHAFAVDADVTCRNIEKAWQDKRSSTLARAFTRSLSAAGAKPRFKLKTGTSDMNVVGPIWQCPIVAYGPGDSALDHTPNEHLVLDEYLKAIGVLEGVLQQ